MYTFCIYIQGHFISIAEGIIKDKMSFWWNIRYDTPINLFLFCFLRNAFSWYFILFVLKIINSMQCWLHRCIESFIDYFLCKTIIYWGYGWFDSKQIVCDKKRSFMIRQKEQLQMIFVSIGYAMLIYYLILMPFDKNDEKI